MKKRKTLHFNQWLCLVAAFLVAMVSLGCSSSENRISGGNSNPMGAYGDDSTNVIPGGNPIIDGTVVNPGAIDVPIVSIPEGGSSIDGHNNAPLLDNMHPGWQQSSCFDCHYEGSKNPEHNYTSVAVCRQCHGDNGLPGMVDNTPPVISSINPSTREDGVIMTWKTNEECVSSFIIRTKDGDKMEYPVSQSYTKNHVINIKGLQPSTTYGYEMIATDRSGNRTSTANIIPNANFTTLDKADTGSSGVIPGPGPDVDPDPSDPSEDPEAFFSNFSYETTRKACIINFKVLRPCSGNVYMYDWEKNREVDLDDFYVGMSNGQITMNFNSLTPGTKYYIQVEAIEKDTGRKHYYHKKKPRTKDFTTDN